VDSFDGLTAYGNAAIAAANTLAAPLDPNSDLASALGNVVYYIGVALTKTSNDGHPMHLPDVRPYWTE
jgi:hypothetical protein